MKKRCPVSKEFAQLVMSAAKIQAWAKDERALCYSPEETRKRLERLAKLKSKPTDRWSASDCLFASRTVSFIRRMKTQRGCSAGSAISLRNWGHASRCTLPKSCGQSERKVELRGLKGGRFHWGKETRKKR